MLYNVVRKLIPVFIHRFENKTATLELLELNQVNEKNFFLSGV
jgi:hypothetical protein